MLIILLWIIFVGLCVGRGGTHRHMLIILLWIIFVGLCVGKGAPEEDVVQHLLAMFLNVLLGAVCVHFLIVWVTHRYP